MTTRRLPASFFPPIALEARSETPKYQQLYEWFRRAILDGRLRPSQRVPSTRSLAAELEISRIPVSSAYEQLHAEGYFETFVGAGTCVARSIPDDALKPAASTATSAHVSAGGSRIAAKNKSKRGISRRAQSVLLPPQTWIDTLGPFRVSLPALEHFPAELWSKLVNRHSRKLTRHQMAYANALGYLPLREAIAEYLGAVRGVKCEATQILVTTGAQLGLQLAAQVLLEPGDRAWIEEPGYHGARHALLMAGAKLVAVSVNRDGLDVEQGIRRAPDARAVYITPSHQYPLGMTMNATQRMLLLNWASSRGAWIFEDDYDSEYRFGERPIASLQSLDNTDRVIYIGTFNKVMFPSLRLGYVVVPKDLIEAFSSARDATDVFSSTLFQAVMTEFIREGHFARHIRKMRMLYMERRTTLVDTLKKEIGDKLEVIGTEAGMHLVALLACGVSDVAVIRRAAKAGISVMPLSFCYTKPPARGGLILGFGGVDERQIREGVRKLAACL
ncbi:MAG: PLP-dependent aminotransferase family protein [Candidatus Acidiferrales bacterium]